MYFFKNIAYIFSVALGCLILSVGFFCFACDEDGNGSDGKNDIEFERQSGWQEHKKKNEQFDLKRLSGVDSYKKRKDWWGKKLEASVPQYKEEKLFEEKAVNEDGPEYQAYLKNKQQEEEKAELARRKYVDEQLCKKTKLKANFLSAEEELGLLGKVEMRELNKRPTGITGKSIGTESVNSSDNYRDKDKSDDDEGEPPFIPNSSRPKPSPSLPMDKRPIPLDEDFDEDFDSPMFEEPEF